MYYNFKDKPIDDLIIGHVQSEREIFTEEERYETNQPYHIRSSLPHNAVGNASRNGMGSGCVTQR